MQIINTYRCNFKCNHCLFSCSPNRKGYLDTYALVQFLDKFNPRYDFVNYCGGETFMHPSWDTQLVAISNYQPDYIRIVTNGTKFITRNGNKTKTFEKFIETAGGILETGVGITIQISYDDYHRYEFGKMFPFSLKEAIDNIHFWISDSLYEIDIEKDGRDKMINSYINIGRASKTGAYNYDGDCLLELDEDQLAGIDLTLDPYNRIYTCCSRAGYIGTVETSIERLQRRQNLIKPQKSCAGCRYLNGIDATNVNNEIKGKQFKIIKR